MGSFTGLLKLTCNSESTLPRPIRIKIWALGLNKMHVADTVIYFSGIFNCSQTSFGGSFCALFENLSVAQKRLHVDRIGSDFRPLWLVRRTWGVNIYLRYIKVIFGSFSALLKISLHLKNCCLYYHVYSAGLGVLRNRYIHIYHVYSL